MWATSLTADRLPTPLCPLSSREPPGEVSTRSTRAMCSSTSRNKKISSSMCSRPAHTQSVSYRDHYVLRKYSPYEMMALATISSMSAVASWPSFRPKEMERSVDEGECPQVT